MRALILTAAPRGSRSGNRVTALRWAAHLRALGHRVTIAARALGTPDVLIALHAVQSHEAARSFRGGRLIVAMTGTDLYGESELSARALATLRRAHRIVALQPKAIERLPPDLRPRARAILQSATALPRDPAPEPQIAVLGHLRTVKAPFLAADAARLLPEVSRIRIVHAGKVIDRDMEQRARNETVVNPRWRWVGELSRREAKTLIARSHALLVTSDSEGGSNVVSEAIACGVPVLSTRIDGSIGQLGPDYPGFFRRGDARALADLLSRFEREGDFRDTLRREIESLQPLFTPERERRAWADLIAECRPLPSSP